MLMRLDVRTDGLGNYVDLPNFYNEHRSISEIDADDIPGSGQLENSGFQLQMPLVEKVKNVTASHPQYP